MRIEPFAKLLNQKFLTIYGNEKVFMKIQNTVERRVLEGSIKAKVLRPYEEAKVGPYHVTPLLADHAKDEQCLIYIISKGSKTILYGHDSGWFPEETWKTLKNFRLDLVILDCTNGALPQIKYHMGLEGDIKAKNKMLEDEIADKDTLFVATHFSHNGGLLYEELREKLEPNGIIVAYDGMTLEL
jgi:phosphoribosyl 1,2-cyclic phosphate phosphodiesterase